MDIVGIILFIFAILFFVTFLLIDSDILSAIFFGIFFNTVFLLGIRLLPNSKPTENDVLKGKATYQETLHVIDNDTIKTYKIVWKKEYIKI